MASKSAYQSHEGLAAPLKANKYTKLPHRVLRDAKKKSLKVPARSFFFFLFFASFAQCLVCVTFCPQNPNLNGAAHSREGRTCASMFDRMYSHKATHAGFERNDERDLNTHAGAYIPPSPLGT